MPTYNALLIDDDEKLFELLEEYLGSYDFELTHAMNGADGLVALEKSEFDVVLLDYMMPEMDGLEVIRQIRPKRDIPILMLTARGDDADRIVGLELGADDYVTKPFNPRELLARLRALMRRSSKELVSELIEVRDIEIDIDGRIVKRAGELVDLTGIEFDILVALARRMGRVVSRDSILSASGRDGIYVGDRTVDVHISHLRRKLGDTDSQKRLIKTVRGVGYVLARD